MTNLAKTFGTPVHLGPHTAHLFPEPGDIIAGPALDAIRAGYRAQYLAHASSSLSHELLEGMHGQEYEEAKEALQLISGVGPKVADCILLFAYGHTEAFPIDTWVAHIMRSAYKCRTPSAMRRKAQKLWGSRKGEMQQYLFHYARVGART
jgi:N-glycosylase/DNA lyase